jgi:ketol-acid reductoisomerase
MKAVLADVRKGKFAEKWSSDRGRSIRELKRLMEKMDGHQIEKVGKEIRRMCGLES